MEPVVAGAHHADRCQLFRGVAFPGQVYPQRLSIAGAKADPERLDGRAVHPPAFQVSSGFATLGRGQLALEVRLGPLVYLVG